MLNCIRLGEHIALVGENGAGKTTIAKLLCRYDPAAGAIRLDGIDLRCVDPAALRREISVVFQDYVRFHLTARENISLGMFRVRRIRPRLLQQRMRRAPTRSSRCCPGAMTHRWAIGLKKVKSSAWENGRK